MSADRQWPAPALNTQSHVSKERPRPSAPRSGPKASADLMRVPEHGLSLSHLPRFFLARTRTDKED
ncbi:hypothetical protein ACSS6W_003422 [Trichoderma asperelloides]